MRSRSPLPARAVLGPGIRRCGDRGARPLVHLPGALDGRLPARRWRRASRRRSAARLGATVCERATGAQGMEPMLAVNSRGTMFMGMATDKGLYEQPGELTGTAENALLRSRNDGRHVAPDPAARRHQRIRGLPVHRSGHRPAVRHVAVRRRDPLRPAGDLQRRRGRSTGPRRPDDRAARRRRLGDWPKIFAGPHRGTTPDGYPNAVYVCNFIPNVLVAASIGCWRSDDGGDHFEFASFLPTVNGACQAGDEQGGTGATIVHGSGRVLANGVVVVPLTVCGEPVVVRSRDEGVTWTAVSTGDDSIGLDDIVGRRRGPGPRDHRPRLVREPRHRRARQPVLRLPRRRRCAPGDINRRRALLAAARASCRRRASGGRSSCRWSRAAAARSR